MTTVKSPAEFPKVLSADADPVRNIWKHSLHDDTGRLPMSDDGFSYEGHARKLTVSWECVQNVRRGKQNSPWALQSA
jgi:hypothetical protein